MRDAHGKESDHQQISKSGIPFPGSTLAFFGRQNFKRASNMHFFLRGGTRTKNTRTKLSEPPNNQHPRRYLAPGQAKTIYIKLSQ